MKFPTFLSLGLWLLCSYFCVSCKEETTAAHTFTSPALLTGSPESVRDTIAESIIVYACHSAGAKKYHLRQNCGGLKRCKHEIVTMTSAEAEKIGLGLCGYED